MAVVGDGGGEEGERMDVGDNKQPSYMDYVQLWLHIMDPSKLKVWPARSRHAHTWCMVHGFSFFHCTCTVTFLSVTN